MEPLLLTTRRRQWAHPSLHPRRPCRHPARPIQRHKTLRRSSKRALSRRWLCLLRARQRFEYRPAHRLRCLSGRLSILRSWHSLNTAPRGGDIGVDVAAETTEPAIVMQVTTLTAGPWIEHGKSAKFALSKRPLSSLLHHFPNTGRSPSSPRLGGRRPKHVSSLLFSGRSP